MSGSRLSRALVESASAAAGVARNRDLRRLELSLAGSVLAHWAYGVAVAVWAYGEGGAAAVGFFGLVRMLPSAVAAPAVALLADRYPRVLVLAGASAVRGAGALLTAGAIAAGAPLAGVFALAALVQVATTAAFPAKAALTPSLARSPTELTAANVVSTTVESVGSFAGPALGGVVLALASVEASVAAAGAAFLLSAGLVARIPRDATPEQARGESLGVALLGGVRAISATPGATVLVGLYAAQTLVAGALNVLIVVLALDLLALGEPAVGYLDAVIGVGGLLAGVAVLARAARGDLRRDFAVGMLLWGVPLALLAATEHLVLAVLLLALIGVGNTVIDVAAVTLLQRLVPDRSLGRVFGVVEAVTWGAIGVGAAAAALAVELVGERGAFVVTGALLPVLVVLTSRRLAAIDPAVRPSDEAVAVIEAVPIFSALPPETRDRLAAALVPLRYAAGEGVIRQGEVGDRLYVIRSGVASVDVDGRPGADLGPGDTFGEIALLRGVPRTATVTARSELEAWALAGGAFVGTLAAHPAVRSRADAVAGGRLRSLRPGGASL